MLWLPLSPYTCNPVGCIPSHVESAHKSFQLCCCQFHRVLQDGKKPAAVPKLEELLAPDSDSEEEPDLVMQLPANKVKYMVGQGGDKIKYIQRKTKCRIQVHSADTCCIGCNSTSHKPCSMSLFSTG